MERERAEVRVHQKARTGQKPGLERIRRLLALLGDPQKELKFVHIAGTNGKGSTAAMLASVLEAAGLTCKLSLPERLPYLCDPDKLARVFDNLLRNACHYSTAGTEVRIAAEQREKGLSLTFANTGITIPPEKLSRIFEQFFRLDAARATRTGGAGLGLAIAKEIVSLHGGAISARSADGVTAFTVRLPAP